MGLRIRSSAPRSGAKLSFTVYHAAVDPLGVRRDAQRPRSGFGRWPSHRPSRCRVQHRRAGRDARDHPRQRRHHPDGHRQLDGGSGLSARELRQRVPRQGHPRRLGRASGRRSSSPISSTTTPPPPASRCGWRSWSPSAWPRPSADAPRPGPGPGARGPEPFEGLLGAVAGSPAVPVTLAPDAATLDELAVTRATATPSPRSPRLSSSSARQTLAGPFVPVDAGALVGAGLPGELAAQLRRGSEVLACAGVGVHATKGTWVAHSPLDQGAVDQLAPDYAHLVVPPGSVSGPTGPLTVTQPFTVAPARGDDRARPPARTTATAMVSDAGLGARLSAAKGADAAARRGAARWPRPRSSTTRSPTSGARAARPRPAASWPWPPRRGRRAPTFVSAAAGRAARATRCIQPVTLDQLFAQVPVGADNEAGARHVRHAGGSSGRRRSRPAAVRAVRGARARQDGLRQRGGGERGGDRHRRRPPTTCSWRRSRACCRRASNRPALAGFEAALGSTAARAGGAVRHHPPHRRHGQRAHHAGAQHAVPGDGGGPAHERQAPVPDGRAPRCPGPSARPPRCRARRAGRASRRCARSTTPPTPCTSTCGRGRRGTSRST